MSHPVVLVAVLVLCVHVISGVVVSRGKPTFQINTAHRGFSKNAVDGKKYSNYFRYSCTHTGQGNHNWWAVDLVSTYEVSSVSIMNRDYHSDRLRDFAIYVSPTDPRPIPADLSKAAGQLCKLYTGYLPKNGPHTITCDQPVTGRFVYLIKTNDNDKTELTLCEFEVNGEAVGAGAEETREFTALEGKFATLKAATRIYGPTEAADCIARCRTNTHGMSKVMQVDRNTRNCECFVLSPFLEDGEFCIEDKLDSVLLFA